MAIQITSAAILRIMRSVFIASGRFRPMTEEEEAQADAHSGVWSAEGTRLFPDVGPPREKCGLLRGRGDRITAIEFLENVSPTPEVAFEIDPAALIAAHRAERRANALQILGYFHTHSTDDPDPSRTDAELAAPDRKLWLIVTSLRARLWRAVPNGRVHGRFDPVPMDLMLGKTLHRGLMEVKHVDYGREHTVVWPPGFGPKMTGDVCN